MWGGGDDGSDSNGEGDSVYTLRNAVNDRKVFRKDEGGYNMIVTCLPDGFLARFCCRILSTIWSGSCSVSSELAVKQAL